MWARCVCFTLQPRHSLVTMTGGPRVTGASSLFLGRTTNVRGFLDVELGTTSIVGIKPWDACDSSCYLALEPQSSHHILCAAAVTYLVSWSSPPRNHDSGGFQAPAVTAEGRSSSVVAGRRVNRRKSSESLENSSSEEQRRRGSPFVVVGSPKSIIRGMATTTMLTTFPSPFCPNLNAWMRKTERGKW